MPLLIHVNKQTVEKQKHTPMDFQKNPVKNVEFRFIQEETEKTEVCLKPGVNF